MAEASNIIHLSFEDNDNLRALLDGALVRQIDILTKENHTLKENNNNLVRMYARQGAELERVREENELLYKDINCTKDNYNQTPFTSSASRLHFKNSKGEHPPFEWVVCIWDALYVLVTTLSKDGKIFFNNATKVCYVYKVITEDTKLTYNYCGTREDFVIEWNDNVVFRLDACRKQKLTCKEHSLNSALRLPIYKDANVLSWDNLVLNGSRFAEMYNVGLEIKKQIEYSDKNYLNNNKTYKS